MISQDVSIDAGAPRAVRNLVGVLADDTPVAGDAQLLASEITTNAIIHGTWLPGDQLTVTIVREEESLSVSVVGPGHPRPVRLRDTGGVGGFGLGLVANIAESWAIEALDDDKTRVWFDLAL